MPDPLKPMNFLFLFSDQHSKRMTGCYGNTKVKTPNLDRLAAEGVRFDAAYCNSPICVPSRAAMATGRYAFAGGYWDNAHAYAGELTSWGGRLHEQGYSVTTIGKLHYKDDRPETGFVDQRIPLNIKNGIGDIYGSIRHKQIARYQFRDAILQAGPGDSDYIKYDKAIARRAADYLRQAVANPGDKPFALFVGMVTPHFPLIAPQEFMDMYPDEDSIALPIQFEQALWPHHPVVDDYRRYCGIACVDRAVTIKAIRAYYALCSFMDAQMGVVLDALRETGLDKTTRIIYSSDHGDTMGDHGVYYKSTMYEGSAGIPMIAAGPDIPKGTSNPTPVSLVDIYPTAVECVGAKFRTGDGDLPGTSLWQFARGEIEPNRAVFSEYYAQGVYTAMFMLRKGDFKYVHYYDEPPQLFNLVQDPNELTDLAPLPEWADKLHEMEAALRRVADPDELERRSRQAQKELLDRHGGEEEFLRSFKPALFSPIPDLGA